MQWVRLLQDGDPVWGLVKDHVIHVCVDSPLTAGHNCAATCGKERLPLEGTPLLPPCQPTKIVCVGRNYGAHARELGNDVPSSLLFFLKPPSSLLSPGAAIQLPPERLTRQVEYEGELGIVIRRRCSRLAPGSDLNPFILGYTCVNDVTARDLQKSDPQWTRAKGFDTFCPVGPFAVEWPTHGTLKGSDQRERGGEAPEFKITTRVNGEVRQQGNTRDFIFDLPTLFAAITEVMTLEPGDLIATGTPAGVGPLRPGDRVSVEIAGVGTLENSVAARA